MCWTWNDLVLYPDGTPNFEQSKIELMNIGKPIKRNFNRISRKIERENPILDREERKVDKEIITASKIGIWTDKRTVPAW